MSTTPLYKKALIIGATSGIGLELASYLIKQGTKVIVVGRRQDRLDAFTSQHNDTSQATSVKFDITKLNEIPNFAKQVTQSHPDLDCIVLNSGIQRPFNFAKPGTVDLSKLDEETTTNYTSYVHLTVALLPHLQRLAHQNTPTHLVYISATLGLVPTLLRTGNYNASKAALHHFILVLREQLRRNGDANLRVVEVFPPAVQTELHDTRHQPDLKNGRELGMPLTAFVEAMYKGLTKGEEQVAVGPATEILNGFEAERQRMFHEGTVQVDKLLSRFLQ